VPTDWDSYYTDHAHLGDLDFSPEPLLVMASEMLPAGEALDLACGAGRNALYLAGLGWRVTAVDRSFAALGLLRQRAERSGAIDIRRADLERGEFTIAQDSYDLICDIRYLQRDLFEPIRQGIRPGGVFAGVILLRGGDGDSCFRLGPGELRKEFESWKILYYSETGAAHILARKA
jgi:SAM-dependent methyltransferase